MKKRITLTVNCKKETYAKLHAYLAYTEIVAGLSVSKSFFIDYCINSVNIKDFVKAVSDKSKNKKRLRNDQKEIN